MKITTNIEEGLKGVTNLGELKDYLSRIGIPDSAPLSAEIDLYGTLCIEMDLSNNIVKEDDDDV